ncbi:MAG: hypothetical protein LBD87_01040 [Prevotellaceae bacterium]|jgi:hypothetical protein|nr:hypothetical protein [Prevotellaceae bacterium]
MDSPFVFSREVINESFVGRKDELSWLASNLSNKENTVLIAPAGYGKKSLVRSAFIQAAKQTELKWCTCNLFNIRDAYSFYTLLAREIFSAACATGDEWIAMAEQLLPLARPHIEINDRKQNAPLQIIFDKQRLLEFADEILQLPEKIAILQNTAFIVWINDFQEITRFDDTAAFQKRLITQWKPQRNAGYLLCGSKINAMRNLFTEKQAFYKFGEQIPLEPIDEKALVDYIVKAFSKSGRVISKEFAEEICRTTCCYPFYVQQFAHLCWLNTKGFVIDSMIDSASEDLLNYNDHFFRLLADDLSDSQINYLHAVIDGIDRFSSAEVIAGYQLHSSANITRVRGALEKKEIITFIRNRPCFINPVFEYWLRKRYFEG